MKLNRILISAAFFLSLVVGGCTATFDPSLRLPELGMGGLPTVKDVREGLEVSLEEYVSANKSRRAFDADIASYGVLPLLLRVENNGTREYKVDRSEIKALLGGQALRPIYGYEAAKQGASREYVGKALVNTAMWGPLGMFFGLPTIIASASHTREVNKKIEQHFENMEFADAMVKPNETIAGFVYFRLPESSQQLENLKVELTVEANGYEEQNVRQLAYKFSFPTLAVSGPAYSPATYPENGAGE